ncbi:MAG: leucine-rich repeat domain-containing protein, partial [Eubacteriales bacterium]|nr:leucine-rich repeat domain-containing protein [Eubacteriales bacterium]
PITDDYSEEANPGILIKVSYDYDWDKNTFDIIGFHNNRKTYNIPKTLYNRDITTIGDGQNPVTIGTTQNEVSISSESATKINANAFNGFSNLKSLTIDNVKSIGEGAFIGTTGLNELLLNGEVIINEGNAGAVFSPNTTVKIPRYEDVTGIDQNKNSWVNNTSRSDNNKGGIYFWSNLVVLDAESGKEILNFGYDKFDEFTMTLYTLKSVLKDRTGNDYINFRFAETDATIAGDINVSGRTVVKADLYVSHKVTFIDRNGNPIKDVDNNDIELQKEAGTKLSVEDIRKALISSNIECTDFELDLNSDSIDITDDTVIKVLYDYDWKVEADDTVTITGIYNNKSEYNIPEKISEKPVKEIGDGTNDSSNSVFKDNNQESITILAPNVTSIGAYTFYDCSNLKSLTIDNVKSIGEGALVGTGLTKL